MKTKMTVDQRRDMLRRRSISLRKAHEQRNPEVGKVKYKRRFRRKV